MKQCRDCGNVSEDEEDICPVCLHIFDELDIENCNIYSEDKVGNANVFLTIIVALILVIITFLIIL